MLKEIIDFIKNNKWYVLLVIGLLGLYFYQFHGGLSSESEKWDHFGSYIGGIFSAVTLLSVLHGMQLERKRFNAQKIEFENEKKEQEERRRKEDFERTFFMMLELHNNKLRILESLQFKNKSSLIDVFYGFILSNKEFNTIRERFIENERFFSEMDSYFINLYRVLRFIDKNKDFNVNNEYSSLLRSFLSRKILLILAVHLCKRENQYDKYIFLINEFSFFEHLDIDSLEFDFLSCITGFDSKLIKNNFKLYVKEPSCLYNNPYMWRASKISVISEGIILKIFERKLKGQEILDGDLTISEYFYKSFGKNLGFNQEIGEDVYDLDHPLDRNTKNIYQNVFLYILDTFTPKAFSSEQENKFSNLKRIYNIFLKELEK
ncbi:putative phage abortive infection protein [Actinobacillus equuli subsp. haemolyticus]|uniref:putative phage abortive infection protein n=1 Tax=Actinobacillus equuli TaxID=718 RepID=UPI00244660DD|nr:putative phage abortive infection protein [Actinobacillus equuli]WGE73410.1 putative phage abortive infection protein [Actinobacillus equuli subsp. haemolyticus]